MLHRISVLPHTNSWLLYHYRTIDCHPSLLSFSTLLLDLFTGLLHGNDDDDDNVYRPLLE